MNNNVEYPPCKYCGKLHGMGIEDCLWDPTQKSIIDYMNFEFNLEIFKDEKEASRTGLLKE